MTETLYRIHPAIGIARLGDAPRDDEHGWLIGPERVGIPAGWDPATRCYRPLTRDGRVLAQAARFRLYRYDANGAREVVRSNSDGVKSVTWQVELENRKAAFFKFCGSLGRATLWSNPLFRLPRFWRNGAIHRAARSAELIQRSEPGELEWSESNSWVHLRNLNPHTAVPGGIERLGELRVDTEGRLLVFAGYGRSMFISELNPRTPADQSLADYANNDGWFDDVADGPITATIVFDDGRHLTVNGENGAWVVCAPPDFAPAVQPLRSMYDTLTDLFVRRRGADVARDPALQGTIWGDVAAQWDSRTLRLPNFRPSFTRDIYPMLRAAAGIRGVFSFEARTVAHKRFDDALMARLGGTGSTESERRAVFDRFRPPRTRAYDLREMPLAHGDSIPLEGTSPALRLWGGIAARLGIFPRTLLTVTPLQYAMLVCWVTGDFEPDWGADVALVASGLPTPHELDRAALENAVGGAFFPGIEASWLLADERVFGAPFRIAAGRVLRRYSPLGSIRIEAGLFSAQMALPWQADFASCAKSPSATGLTQVAWWPSQRPDDVYVRDPATGLIARQPWTRGIDSNPDENIRHWHMVKEWSRLGFVIEEGDEELIEQPR